ncbi:MAG: adenylosuccinate synthase [Phycisphaerae bacterium]|jgi:adenylosuccinate synthase
MMNLRDLGNTCVLGLQWGDEGKGKIVDLLVEHFDVVVRYGGGANAGHTVVVDRDTFALHQLPSGILRPDVLNVITSGTVIDPAALLGEIATLRQRGIAIGDNLRISNRAHLVFPYHRQEDVLAERAARKADKLGTTARGIGPCYGDKVARRWGIRVCDLLRPERLRERVAAVVAHKNAFFPAVYESRTPFDAAAIADEYLAFADALRPHVCDTSDLLHGQLRQGKRVLFEGAQGSLLDIDHGTYPFVTSSNTIGFATGAGVPASTVRSVIGVVKAYTTRVGSGPFPTELTDVIGDSIRDRGGEFGTTTGRPRRCGWFDVVAAGYAARISGSTHLAVMHLDTLSGMDEIRMCVGYRHDGHVDASWPADADTLTEVTPVYETFPGWAADVGGCRHLADLPAEARQYLSAVSTRLGVPLGIVGVGPARDQTIFVEEND